MAKTHMKEHTASLVFREIEIKLQWNHRTYSLEWLKWKRQTITRVDNNKEVKEQEFSLIPDENVKSYNLFGKLGS